MTHEEAFRIWRQDAKCVPPDELRKAMGHIYGCDQCFRDFLGEREYEDSGGAVTVMEEPQRPDAGNPPAGGVSQAPAAPAKAGEEKSWVDDLSGPYQEFLKGLNL